MKIHWQELTAGLITLEKPKLNRECIRLLTRLSQVDFWLSKPDHWSQLFSSGITQDHQTFLSGLVAAGWLEQVFVSRDQLGVQISPKAREIVTNNRSL